MKFVWIALNVMVIENTLNINRERGFCFVLILLQVSGAEQNAISIIDTETAES